MTSKVTDVRGIGPAAATTLAAHGFKTVRSLATASVDSLSKVPGFGPARAVAVIGAAGEVMAGDGAAAKPATKGAAKPAAKGTVAKSAAKPAKDKKKKKSKDDKDLKKKSKKGKKKKSKK